jgi:hypothetical protein
MSAVFPTTLDVTTFQALYPEYYSIQTVVLNDLWIAVENISPGFIWNYTQQMANSYWFKVLAHLCQLRLTRQPGRVVSGVQGDTTTSFENIPQTSAGSLQWWSSTNWGLEIAQLIRRRGGSTYIV